MKTENLLGSKNKLLNTVDASANFIIGLVMIFVLQFVFVVLLMMAKIDYESFTSAFIGTCVICVVNELAYVVTPLGYCKVKDSNYYKDMGIKFNLSIVDILLCIAIALATIAFSSPLANWFVDFIISTGFDTSALATMEIVKVSDLILGLIFLSLVPAVVEEMLFRGIIARGLKRKGLIFAIFMSAFMFAIMHGTPIQLVHQFVLGAICCLVYFVTKNIIASIIIHFTNNAVAIIGSYILYVTENTEGETSVGVSIAMVIVGLIALLALLFVLFNRYCKKNEKVSNVVGYKRKLEILAMTENEEELIEQENAQRQAQLDLLDTQEKKDVYNLTIKEASQKQKHLERRSLIYAIGVGLVIFAIQTAVCYL